MNARERLYATLRGEPRDRTPVTPIFMTWAAHAVGRTYRDFYLDGGVLAEAQIAVTRRFDVDQVSAISDPWREAEGYGMEFDYPEEGVGVPRAPALRTGDEELPLLDIGRCPRMKDRVEAVRRMAEELGETHSVLGWIEGPMAEYADLRSMTESMTDLFDKPERFTRAAEVLSENAVRFSLAQIEAGADMIGIGDAAASLIGPDLYARLVLPWEQRIVEAIHAAGAVVKLHICGDISRIVGDMTKTGVEIIDVDWMVPLAQAREAVGTEVTLCGNLDPAAVLLRGTPERVAEAARQCIADAGDRFVLMPGCEVPPGTPEANIRAFCPGEGCPIEDALRR